MKKKMLRLISAMLVLLMLLPGCDMILRKAPEKMPDAESGVTEAVETTEPTVPATVPADGNPDDVTCKGSYTVEDAELKAAAGNVVATVYDQELTAAKLQIYYWMEVAAYRAAGHEASPDFDKPLDSQTCQIDGSVNSWQQYFLQRALNTWHSHQALVLQGIANGAPTEEAYKPNEKRHVEYMTDQPATKVLYGHSDSYRPNSQHQAYLEDMYEKLNQMALSHGFADVSALAADMAGAGVTEEDLRWYADLSNRAYMYFTELHYEVDDPTEEEVNTWYESNSDAYSAIQGRTVNVRQVMLVPETPQPDPVPSWVTPPPLEGIYLEEVSVAVDGTVSCSEDMWAYWQSHAESLLSGWAADRKSSEATFADLAHKNSDDAGSNKNGGMYAGIAPGQLTKQLDEWCFDEARQPGDTTIIRTPYGIHILYFSGSCDNGYAAAEEDYITDWDKTIVSDSRNAFPMTVNYGAIVLGTPANTAGINAVQDILYPDVAHQRFPDVPLYLQQDYPDTMYGAFKITSHGCGITTMAMLASYMADDALTPPIMCERYSDYSFATGTDGSLFNEAPAEMNFYLMKKSFNWKEAKAAMEEGYLVVCVQQKGYWTRGGHYLVLEKLVEDGRVQVRDSNIFNYGRLHDHKKDSFTWGCITPAGMAYWIYDYKRVSIPACWRCGDETMEGLVPGLMTADYTCEKCVDAQLRRSNFLTLSAE